MGSYNNDRESVERVIKRIKERTKSKAEESDYYFRRGRVLWRMKERNISAQQIEQRFELEMELEEEADKNYEKERLFRTLLEKVGFTIPEANKILERKRNHKYKTGSVGN